MKIGIIGLGYVGLPLSVAFSKKFEVIGFDINEKRINELNLGIDSTLEISSLDMKNALKNKIIFTNQMDLIKECNFFVVTVPTPIDKAKKPNLTPLLEASKTIGKVLKKGDIVVYESTVYPGATEEECVPILEKISKLKFNKDFFCGYSPERINPGDKNHTVDKIKKVVSGSTPKIAKKINEIYSQIIDAGTYIAPNIKVAEAAKVIENTQRDINIAFVNELAMIFEKMGIDTNDVLEAACTKWNFLNFKPGLVGGHCIGVDPYYLTHKAEELGFHPEMILAGRRINDNMGIYIANQILKMMIKNSIQINNAEILILGITFKENCTDIRNSRVIDVVRELKDFGCKVDVYDPWASSQEVEAQYGIDLLKNYNLDNYKVIVLAVAHNEFKEIILDLSPNILIYDIKNISKIYTKRL